MLISYVHFLLSSLIIIGPGALNVPNWEHLGDGVGCANREWLANVYPTFSWGDPPKREA